VVPRAWPFSPGAAPISTPCCFRSWTMVVMSARRGTLCSTSFLSLSRAATMSGSEAFLEPEMRISPLSWRPPLMRIRSMVAPSDLRQGDAALALVLAGLVAVGDFAGLVALQEQELRGAFVGVYLGGQRRGVGEFQGDVALPLRLERCDVHDDAAARIGRLADADHQHVARDAEIFHGPRQGEGVGRDDADVGGAVDEAVVGEVLGVDHRRIDVGEDLEVTADAR